MLDVCMLQSVYSGLDAPHEAVTLHVISYVLNFFRRCHHRLRSMSSSLPECMLLVWSSFDCAAAAAAVALIESIEFRRWLVF